MTLLTTLLTLLALVAPAVQEVPDEKELRAEFKKSQRSKDPSERVAGLAIYANATRDLEDGGTAKLVAKTLATALDDEDMAVAAAAVSALAWGRHPDTVIDAMDDAMEEWRGILEKTATRPDEESRDLFRGALAVYRDGCALLARYKDDRTTDLLEGELKALRTGGVLENIAQNLVPSVSRALLDLGSRDAVEYVIKATAVYTASTFKGTSPMEKRNLAMAEDLHDALAEFAIEIERAPPAFTQNYQQDWHDWFKEHKELFPRKLGKLEEPPPAPEYVPPEERRSNRPTGERERP